MTFTVKQINGAAILVAAEAMSALPKNIADFLTESMSASLMDDIREATKENLLFSLTNHLSDL